jgi:hypothetical protein
MGGERRKCVAEDYSGGAGDLLYSSVGKFLK